MKSEIGSSDSIAKRRLTVTHMAIARGWIQGLELGELANRYMGDIGEEFEEIDLRKAKTVLTWILDDLASLAKRSGIAGGITLHRQAMRIRIDPNAPSLTDFTDALGVDEDFYSEAELTELYQLEHGEKGKKSIQAEARRGRLIKRQMNLVTDLTIHLSAAMVLNDKVTAWIEDSLATRLFYSGFESIEQLAVAIVRSPDNWYEAVKGIGQGKASRICRFLVAQLGPLDDCLAKAGIFVPSDANLPALDFSKLVGNFDAESKSTGTPSPALQQDGATQNYDDLSGINGALRTPKGSSATSAKNDYEAMETWLAQKQSELTRTLYRREIERLMAWAIRERSKALSSLHIEDALQYRTFLSNVPHNWITSKGPRQPFAPGEWNTFAGSLKKSSIKKALVIITGFFKWLKDINYVHANPFAGVRPITPLPHPNERSTSATDLSSVEVDQELHNTVLTRTLPHMAKEAVEEELNATPNNEFRQRARLVFHFAIETGLRVSEMSAARWAQVRYHEASSGEPGYWTLDVIGKRRKPRTVLMSSDLVGELLRYFEHRNLPCTTTEIAAGTYLIGRLPKDVPANPNKAKRPVFAADGVRPQTLHRTLVTLFKSAGQRLGALDKESKKRLEKASAHWLRHTCATDMLGAGVPTDVVMDTLGHNDIATTSIYIHPDKSRSAKSLQQYWGTRSGAAKKK